IVVPAVPASLLHPFGSLGKGVGSRGARAYRPQYPFSGTGTSQGPAPRRTRAFQLRARTFGSATEQPVGEIGECLAQVAGEPGALGGGGGSPCRGGQALEAEIRRHPLDA